MTLAKCEVSGILNLAKPIGETSRDTVNRITRLQRRLKAGHAGTLDPLASGVLVVCVGGTTRLIELIQRMSKTYRTVIRLGAVSDTLDADGVVEPVPDAREPDIEAIRAALAGQTGLVLQRPPAFSALKVNGRRAYDLARSGEVVELAPRPVTIRRIDLVSYCWPRLEIEVECGGGTYIRSIARDVGETLGCGGLVEVLTRTRIGVFRLEDAIDPALINAKSLEAQLRPSLDAAADLTKVVLSAEEVEDVRHGRSLPAAGRGTAGELALLTPGGALLALGEFLPAGERIIPRKVLESTAS